MSEQARGPGEWKKLVNFDFRSSRRRGQPLCGNVFADRPMWSCNGDGKRGEVNCERNPARTVEQMRALIWNGGQRMPPFRERLSRAQTDDGTAESEKPVAELVPSWCTPPPPYILKIQITCELGMGIIRLVNPLPKTV